MKQFEAHKPLLPYLTIRPQAEADQLVVVTSRAELIEAVQSARQAHLPVQVLGGGSNVAVTSSTLPGLTIINRDHRYAVLEEDTASATVEVSAGYPVALLLQKTIAAGYAGLEYHMGLPGTVGGAIYMNSKWMHPETYFGDPLISATLLDDQGNEKKVNRDYFEFAYDHSILQKTREIVLEVVFRFTKEKPEILQQHANEAKQYREQTQPPAAGTSGCFFRNISREEKDRHGLPTTSAGYLIDKAGLKGASRGGYVVSDKHANFIVNKGGGTGEDLAALLHHIKDTVKKTFGVELQEEVIIW